MPYKSYDPITLKHYKRIADHFGDSALSTMEDTYVREKEIFFFTSEIDRFLQESNKQYFNILDIGCGNGYLLSILRDRYPNAKMYGLEFTPELYNLAKNREIQDCTIIQGDIRKNEFINNFKDAIDIVICERVIINILHRKDQLDSLINIHKTLQYNGLLLLSESFKESQKLLSDARQEMCLDPIKDSHQNLYLSETQLLKLSRDTNLKEIQGVLPKNYLSTHFYITRVFHKSIRPDGGKVKFSKMSDFFTSALPAGVGNYSPIQFRVFKNINKD